MKAQKILVYLGATSPEDKSFTNAVQELGEGIAQRGMTLVYGGSRKGTMTVLADAVMSHGGKIIGIFTKALPMGCLYPGLTETVITEDLAERKTTMFNLADAIIAMPGSFGTWDELFDALERSKIELMHGRPTKPIALLNLNGYYDSVMTLLRHSVEIGYTTPEYEKLLFAASSVQELFAWLENQSRN